VPVPTMATGETGFVLGLAAIGGALALIIR
jgi:hypothetical protein